MTVPPAGISRWVRIGLAAWLLVLLGFAIWTRQPMCREGLWRDDAISVYASQAPSLSELLRRNRISDYNPPLFNLGLAGWSRLAGSEESEVKLFALILGLLNAAGCTLLAYEIGGGVAAALAAALVINNPLLIEMSTEARPYSLSAFLAVISIFVIFRIRKDPRAGFGRFAFLTVLLALLVYSHIAGGVVAGVLLSWGALQWLQEPANPFGRRLAASAALAGATFLFWLPTTWRQFRTGIPWEHSLSFSENLESLVRRSGDVLPIPGAFEQSAFLVGMAALAVIGTLQAGRVIAGLRREGQALLVPAVAGAVVWLVLGLFSSQVRYLIIPASLGIVVLSAVASQVFESGWKARGANRGAAIVALAGLVAGSFTARADLYEGRSLAASRPKSGVRSLCQSRPFATDELVVVAPDYLAPALWYYCGRLESIRGFARWDRPVLFDPRDYAELWNDPASAAGTVARIEDALRKQGRSRFALVLDEPAGGLPPFYGRQVEKLQAELARKYDARSLGRFQGRVESVEALVLSPR